MNLPRFDAVLALSEGRMDPTRVARLRTYRRRPAHRVASLTTIAGMLVATLTSSAAVVAPGAAYGLSTTCQAASGVVRDVYGNPVQGALVDTRPSDCSQPTATTNAAGQYSVQIQPSVSGTPATVSGTEYASKATTITVTGGTTGANNVGLLYKVESAVSPTAVRSGSTITLTASTTAPAASQPGYACSWGGGPLGNGSTVLSTPTPVSAVGGNGVLSGVRAIAGGRDAGYALLINGTVAAWGANDTGQLGNGSGSGSTTPVLVSAVGGAGTLTGVTAIAGGYDTAYALLSNGEVVSWGDNNAGQLGNGTAPISSTTPVLVAGVGGAGTLSGVTAIAAGSSGGYALLSNGEVAAWGDNGLGELGNGTGISTTTPVFVSGVGGAGALAGITAIAAGEYNGYARLSNGEVAAWGYNNVGQLGDGTTTNAPTPVLVSGVGGSGVLGGVTAIASAQQTGYAVLSDGTEVAWGYGSDGELGNGPNSDPTNGSPNDAATPVHVSAVGGPPSTLHNVSAVGAGEYSGYARLSNGTAVGWGYGLNGQLGDNQENSADSPVSVVTGPTGALQLTGVSQVTSGPLSTAGYAVRAVPCTDTRSAVRVIVQSPDGSVVPLSQGVTDGSGSTSWSGSYTIPSGTAEGTYGLKVCGVDVTFNGNCDQAATAGAPALVTAVESQPYLVDNTPPSMYASTPAPFSTVTSVGTLQITWSDNLSGVDPSSVSLSVDGTTVTPTVSASGLAATLSWDASGLAPGVHQVNTQASDKAGNVAPAVSFPITIGSLSAGPATAANTGPTVINSDPSGAAVGPRTVTFHGVQVQVGTFSESLSASTWVGHGTVGRPVTFGPFTVTFKDSVVSQSSSAVSVSVVVPHVVATVSPSAGALSALIPATTYTLPDFTVSVPTAFPNAPGSTATLPALSGSLGSPVPLDGAGHVTNQLLSSTFLSGQQIDVIGGLTACMARDAAGNNVATAKCSANPSPTATVYVNGQQLASLLQPVSGPADTSLNHSDAPTCVGTGGCVGLTGSPTTSYVDSAYSSLSLGCGPYTISVQTGVGATYNLCTGLPMTGQGSQFAGVYVNAWVFKDNTSGHYHLWQQDQVDPGSIATCPNGLSPSGGSPGLTSGVYRAAANTLALDQATGANIGGSFKKNTDNPQTLNVSLGTTTQADYQSNETAGAVSATNNTVDYTIDSPSLNPQSLGAGQGFYQVLPGQSVDALGDILASPSSTANQWTADTSNPLAYTSTTTPDTTTPLQLITGSDFAAPAPSGGYVYSAQLPFQLALTYSCA